MPEKTKSRNVFHIAFYQRVSDENCTWQDSTDWSAVEREFEKFTLELEKFQIQLLRVDDPAEIIVRGYADVLNSIRLRYPDGGFYNTCLGHIIGRSAERDLSVDLKRGVNRVLFAPETIEPQGSDKVVCHNCGCGC